MCIDASDLRKNYGLVTALDGLSVKVPCGAAMALIGPNGAGKTTTLRILAGLLRPDSGSVIINGFNMYEEPMKAKAVLGYLPEDASPFLTLTVRENMEYIGALRRMDRAILMDKVNYLLDELELREYENSQVARLSRGNRQKVAIALAVLHDPKVLLMDEPLNYLDIPTQERVIKMLNAMHSRGTTILVSTHIMSIAQRLADQVLIINKGHAIWSGSMTDLAGLSKNDERIEEVVARLMSDE
ncbi:multidrug ABC transporter ATP-binding protein [Thermocladium modestius]|uniref:Multidrug ABC transporter ATP-binding protein n=1 Tax=Thermocladium modestius TaxID=62609 RepID=A0A830GVL4_9CREN|nr:ABC transporter ATP-binding protein [Thermocladium modestius]GGP20468.1 multidrug ABC transporter ATP-binding protein [Thermocladium modestius]